MKEGDSHASPSGKEEFEIRMGPSGKVSFSELK